MLSTDEYRAKKQDEMNAIIEKLEQGVRDVFTSENYENYLRTFSKFHNYSYSNTILILQQFPSASQVASYKTWQELGRQVKKGEKGIKVLVPKPKKIKEKKIVTNSDGTETEEETSEEKKIMYYGVGAVFNITQTEPLPNAAHLPSLVKELNGAGEMLDPFLDRLIATSEVKVEFDNSLGEFDANGYYNISENSIAIKPTLPTLHKLKTLFHEYSHYLQETEFAAQTESSLSREFKECIAESCAFCTFEMLANESGIKVLDSSDYSFGYVAGWGSRDLKELRSTLSTISKISNKIYDWAFPNLEKVQHQKEERGNSDGPSRGRAK